MTKDKVKISDVMLVLEGVLLVLTLITIFIYSSFFVY